MKKGKLQGFTLSEALIALAIVGIISALTVPNIVANYQRQAFINGLKKSYIDLQDNLTTMQTEDYRRQRLSGSMLDRKGGAFMFGNSKTVSETAGAFFKTYYNINRDCGTDTQPCFASTYVSLNGSNTENFTCTNGYSVLLANGSAMCIIPPRSETSRVCIASSLNCAISISNFPEANVYIDVNGPNLPNIGGRDMFTFNIYEDFSLDEVSPDNVKAGTAEGDRNNLYNTNCTSSATGVGCFGKILNDNWEMNY